MKNGSFSSLFLCVTANTLRLFVVSLCRLLYNAPCISQLAFVLYARFYLQGGVLFCLSLVVAMCCVCVCCMIVELVVCMPHASFDVLIYTFTNMNIERRMRWNHALTLTHIDIYIYRDGNAHLHNPKCKIYHTISNIHPSTSERGTDKTASASTKFVIYCVC